MCTGDMPWYRRMVWYFYPRILVLGMGRIRAVVSFLAWVQERASKGVFCTTSVYQYILVYPDVSGLVDNVHLGGPAGILCDLRLQSNLYQKQGYLSDLSHFLCNGVACGYFYKPTGVQGGISAM